MNNRIANVKLLDNLLLQKNDHFERVLMKDILFFKADADYCTVYTKLGRFDYAVELTKLEPQLPTNLFMRVHKDYVVHVNAISGFEGRFLYISENKIPVSKQYQDDVLKVFRSI